MGGVPCGQVVCYRRFRGLHSRGFKRDLCRPCHRAYSPKRCGGYFERAFAAWLRENPEFAPLRSFEMQAIGGQVDQYIAHGGVYGRQCERWFEEAITDKPRATVVIMPVTGLLPGVGPYGEDKPNCSLKKLLIEVSLKVSVRWLIFVTDYTKHLPSRAKKGVYGLPVFTVQAEWQQLLTNHSTRIRIITTPHPQVRGQTRSQPFLRRASHLRLPFQSKEKNTMPLPVPLQIKHG